MWPFRRAKLDDLQEKRLRDVELRQQEMEREWKAVLLEWEDMFAKFRRMYAKIAKASKVEPEGDGEAPTMPSDRRTHGRQGEPPMSPAAARLLAGGAANGILSR